MHFSGLLQNTQVYNNVKQSVDIDWTIVKMDSRGGPWPKNSLFANNIFYVVDNAGFDFCKYLNTKFSKQLFLWHIRKFAQLSGSHF